MITLDEFKEFLYLFGTTTPDHKDYYKQRIIEAFQRQGEELLRTKQLWKNEIEIKDKFKLESESRRIALEYAIKRAEIAEKKK